MKVIDIISTSNLQEQGLIAKGLEYLGKGAASAYKGVKGVVDSKSLVTNLSQHPGFMRRILKGDPPSVAEIERMYGKKAAEIVRKDDTIFSKAANKYYSARQAAVKSAGKSGASAAEKAYVATATSASKVTGFLNKVWGAQVAYLIGDSIYECWSAISLAEEKLKAGEISPELYEKTRSMWISHTVSKLAMAGAGALVIKGLGSTSTGFLGKIHPSLGWLSNTVKQLGQSWWMYYAQTPEGGNELASWIVGTSMIGMINQHLITSAYDATLGQFTKMADTSARNMQSATNQAVQQQGQGANPTQSSKDERDATSTKPVPGTNMTQTAPQKDRFYDLMKGSGEVANRILDKESNKW